MVRVYAAALAVLSLLPGPSRADGAYTPSPLKASELLQKARAAVGGDAGGTYTLVTRTHTTAGDSTSTLFVNGKDSIAKNGTGELATWSGTYGGQDWSQDANGIVTLASNFYGTVDPNELALKNPDDPASGVTVLGVTADAPKQIVLDINPPNGEHEIRSYDAATYLLTKVVRFEKDHLTHVSTFSDYRSALGHTIPYRTTYGDGRPENDEVITTLSFAVPKAPFPSTLIPKSRSLFTFASNAPIVLPARFINSHVVVRVIIAGRGLDFLLDSGASDIVIDSAVAHGLGLVSYDKQSGTIGGSFTETRTVIPQIQIGSATINNLVAEQTDIGLQLPGAKIVGLLGYDVLASGVFAIDFSKETATLYPPGTAPLSDPALARVPIDADDGVARVRASFDGVTGHFLLDTGSDATVLTPEYFSRIKHWQRQNDADITMSFVGGDMQLTPYDIADLIFGQTEFRKATVYVPHSTLADLAGYDGLIGRDVIGGYTLIFDYPDRLIFVKPT